MLLHAVVRQGGGRRQAEAGRTRMPSDSRRAHALGEQCRLLEVGQQGAVQVRRKLAEVRASAPAALGRCPWISAISTR